MANANPSPNILNYFIGKGIVEILKDGDTVWRRLGNVPKFEFTPTVETLEHFSSMGGIKTRDRIVAISKKADVAIEMDEVTADNLAFALLGTLREDGSSGDQEIDILTQSQVTGQVRLIGTNDVGSKFTWTLYSVSFTPNGAISMIGDAFGTIAVKGDCSAVNGSFGLCQKTADGA